jgi:hypothetical protein
MDVEFRQLFSEKSGVGAEQFERRLFRKCLFRHALPFAWLLQKLDPHFFREDFEMLRDIASARNTDEVICELNRFFGRNARDKSIFRTVFYIRVSGKRVLRLYRKLTRAGSNSDSESSSVSSETLHPA